MSVMNGDTIFSALRILFRFCLTIFSQITSGEEISRAIVLPKSITVEISFMSIALANTG